jgi:hypothetical protein
MDCITLNLGDFLRYRGLIVREGHAVKSSGDPGVGIILKRAWGWKLRSPSIDGNDQLCKHNVSC